MVIENTESGKGHSFSAFPMYYKMPTSGQSGWSRLYPDPSKALTLGNSGNNENFASPPVETAFPSPSPL